MKKIYALILSFSLVTAGAFAQDVAEKAIPTLVKDKKWKGGCSNHLHRFVGNYDTIQSSGMVAIKDSSIAKDVVVAGRVKIENSEMASLQAKGSVSLVDSDIAQGAQVQGRLYVKNCSIAGSLKVNSHSLHVKGSTIDSIVFESTKDETQKVYLGEGTQVTGPITFANGKGKIYAAKGVEIAGPITGGEIVKSKK